MWIYFFLLFCVNANGNSYVISEILSSSQKSNRGESREWIEVSNLGAPFLVKDLSVEIAIGERQPTIFQKFISLPKPVTFEDHLLIAQNRQIGLNQCLSHEPLVVVVPGISVKRREHQRFCVTINGGHKTCVTKRKKVKMIDGISLFRELTDLNEEPLWRNEPCHLVDNVFASPGAPDRFCQEIKKEALLQRCDYLKEIKVTRSKTFSFNLGAELLNHLSMEQENDELNITLHDKMKTSIFVAEICAHPPHAQKLCHIVESEKMLRPTEKNQFSLASWTKEMGLALSVRVNDILGNNGKRLIGIKRDNPKYQVHASPEFVLTHQDQSHIRLDLVVNMEDLPVNLFIRSPLGEPLYQRAFVESGRKTLDITIKPEWPHLEISYQAKNGNHLAVKPLIRNAPG